MKIALRAFGLLSDYLEGMVPSIETEGPDLSGLFKQLTIPEDLVMLATVNGEAASFERRLKEGDQVVIVPPVAGG
jgi:molybdopterin converting factor small subunit